MTIHTDHKNIIELITGDLIQFHIPIYQRNYTWSSKSQTKKAKQNNEDGEVGKLINDIIEFGKEYPDNHRAEYYFGSIIIKNQTRGMLTERVVIDGQQRITTTVLTLCAIRDIYRNQHISDENEKQAQMIQKSLYQKEDDEIKLKLNNMEHQDILSQILSGENSSLFNDNSRYKENYNYIYGRLARMDENNFSLFVGLLQRVKVVIISLDEDQDENSVFESINSTGKPLAGSDLIKNYLFTFNNYQCLRNDETNLINLYTNNFENLFKNEKETELEMEHFFRTYIAIKTAKLVIKDAKVIYYQFKKTIGQINSVENCKIIIADLSKWANIYQSLKTGKLKNINDSYLSYLKVCFDLYSVFLMKIVEKYSIVESNEIIINNSDEINKVFKAIVAYDAARILADFPQAELIRWTPMLLTKNHLEQDNYQNIESYADRFRQLVTTTNKAFKQPNGDELSKSVITSNLYTRKKKFLKRLLILLENIGKKELFNYELDLKQSTIEHIMPQSLTPEWNYISDEEHKEYLHTLGNLTLTFDNSKLSNLSFDEKKQILADNSRMIMNNELNKYENFDIQTIKKRANDLLDKFSAEYL